MAAPNIAETGQATLDGFADDLPSTTSVTLVSNAASSGDVIEVVSLFVCNDDGTNDADITINVHPEDDAGGTAVELVSAVTVPAKATLVVITKEAPIYLEENTSLAAVASAGGDLNCVGSYRVIS